MPQLFFNYRESAARGNFHFIGPALGTMCTSIREKVLTLGDGSKPVKVIKKGELIISSARAYYMYYEVTTITMAYLCIYM